MSLYEINLLQAICKRRYIKDRFKILNLFYQNNKNKDTFSVTISFSKMIQRRGTNVSEVIKIVQKILILNHFYIYGIDF